MIQRTLSDTESISHGFHHSPILTRYLPSMIGSCLQEIQVILHSLLLLIHGLKALDLLTRGMDTSITMQQLLAANCIQQDYRNTLICTLLVE